MQENCSIALARLAKGNPVTGFKLDPASQGSGLSVFMTLSGSVVIASYSHVSRLKSFSSNVLCQLGIGLASLSLSFLSFSVCQSAFLSLPLFENVCVCVCG